MAKTIRAIIICPFTREVQDANREFPPGIPAHLLWRLRRVRHLDQSAGRPLRQRLPTVGRMLRDRREARLLGLRIDHRGGRHGRKHG